MKKRAEKNHRDIFQSRPFFPFTRKRESSQGQAVSAEYVVVLLVVVGALTAMTVYMRRTIQARAYDAQTLMIAKASKGLEKPILDEYEPYYTNSTTKTEQRQTDASRVLSLGDYRKELDLEKSSYTESRQEPPQDAE